MSKALPASSITPGSPSATSATRVSNAAGKQRETAGWTIERFKEESHEMMEKIKHTAGNVTTCQSQIDQVFSRATALIVALVMDCKTANKVKIQEAGMATEEILKDFHKHVLRFAIYGRPKAFVNRAEISAYFEQLNIQMDATYKSFAVEKHLDMENWETEYYQAKFDDEAAANEQLWEILNSESDLKTVMEMGQDAVDGLKAAVNTAVSYPHSPPDRKEKLEYAATNLSMFTTDEPGILQPYILLNKPKPRQQAPVPTPSYLQASASSSTTPLPTRPSSTSAARPPPAFDDIVGRTETPTARAKRLEAEQERALSREKDGEYADPSLPLWEPRRPPPGRGPGSMDETIYDTQQLSGSIPPAPKVDIPEDMPPSYS